MNLKIRKLLAAVLVLAMVVGFLPMLDLSIEAKAADVEKTDVVYEYVFDISDYRENQESHAPGNNNELALDVYTDYPAKDGYVFAGWYSDIKHMLPLDAETKTGGAYAKFVPEKLMKAVAQVSVNTVYMSDKAGSALRFVAAVDSLDYDQIGFRLKNPAGKTYTHASTKVYKSLSAHVVGGDILTPGYFGAQGQYMFALTLGGLENQDDKFTATPFWITKDGTKVDHVESGEKTVEMGIALNVADPNVPTTIPSEDVWYKDSNEILYINNAAEFASFVNLSNTYNFAGRTVMLSADIAFNDGIAGDKLMGAGTGNPLINGAVATDPIGSATVPFAGTFDGQGHTISGLVSKTGYDALFAAVKDATIKNVKVARSTLRAGSGGGCSAGLVGTTYGTTTIENVYIGKDVNLWNATHQGGVVAYNQGNLTIKNTWSEAYVNPQWGAKVYIGGIVGDNANTAGLTLTLENCLYSGTMSGTAQGTSFAGGLVGASMNNPVTTVTDCLVTGSMQGLVTSTGSLQIGSVIGSKSFSGATHTVTTDVYATAETYKNAEGAAQTIRADQKFASGVTAVEAANILGDLAKTNASGLDYTAVWTTVTGSTPVLRMADPKAAVDTSWYNDTDTEFTLYTAAELNGLAYLSKTNTFAGKTVKLGADITYNTGNAADWAAAAPAYTWTPIGDSDDGFKGVFDGQGHTISGLYYKAPGYAAVFARVYSAAAAINNVKVVNSYLESTAADSANFHHGAGIIGRGNNGFTVSNVYTDAILKGIKAVGIVAFSDAGNVTMTNCWFDGAIIGGSTATNIGGMVGSVVNNMNHNFTNCLFTGTVSGPSAYVGGIVGIGPYGTKTNMTSCLVAGDMTGVTSGVVGSVIGNNPGGNGSTYTNVYATNETHTNLAGAGGALSKFTVTAVAEADITGEAAKSVLSGLTFDDPKVRMGWLARSNDVPALDSYEIDGIDLTWYDANAAEYVLMDADDLLGFAYLGSTGGVNFSGKTIKLGADIVLNTGDASTWGTNPPANAWTPITTEFKGTFDGDGHTISGLYLNSSAPADSYDGMFKLSGGAIKNVTFENSYVTGTGKIGAIIGAMTGGSVTNVHVKGTVKGGDYAGGLIGYHAGGSAITIDGCSFDGAISGGSNLGGIISFRQNAGNETIKNCTVSGTITGTGTRLGGIAGFAGNSSGTILIENCNVSANINTTHTGQNECGGIVGNYLGATVTVRNCHYTGKLTAGGYGNGGMAGAAKVNTTIENCSFTGEIEAGSHWLGGMIGYVYGGTITLNNDMSTGKIVSKHASNSAIGSMIGRNNGGTVNATGCFGVLNAYYKTSTLKEGQIGQGTVNGDTALISNKVRALMEEYYNAGIALDFTNGFAKYWATSTPFEISTVGQFFAFNLMGQCYDFSGKTVKLTADITINSGNASDWVINAPKYNWTPIGGMSGAPVTKFAGTFDGQGHTISGIYCAFPSGNSMGLFRENSGTITNFKLVNSHLENTDDSGNYGYNGGIAACLTNGTISKVYTDAYIQTVDSYAGGIVGYTVGDNATVSECHFAGELLARCDITDGCKGGTAGRGHAYCVGGIAGAATATNTNVNNCLVDGTIMNECNTAHKTGGIVGTAPTAGKSLNITSSLFAGQFVTLNRDNASIHHFCFLTDGRGDGTFDADIRKNNYVVKCDQVNGAGVVTLPADGMSAAYELTGGTTYTEADLIAYLAENYDNGILDFDTVWVRNENALPTLQIFTEGYEPPVYKMYGAENDIPMLELEAGTLATYTGAKLVANDSGATDAQGNPLYYVEMVDATEADHSDSSFDRNYYGSFENVYYGEDTYVTKYVDVELSEFNAFVEKLRSKGFKVYSRSNIEADAYNVTMIRSENEYSLTYFANTKETYITVSKNMELSPYLLADNDSATADVADNAVVEMVMVNHSGHAGGDSYIYKLKNGHFVIFDAGNEADTASSILAALEKLSGRDLSISGDGKGLDNNACWGDPLVVDAWFITHPHSDHINALNKPYGAINMNVLVKGLYLNNTENYNAVGGAEGTAFEYVSYNETDKQTTTKTITLDANSTAGSILTTVVDENGDNVKDPSTSKFNYSVDVYNFVDQVDVDGVTRNRYVHLAPDYKLERVQTASLAGRFANKNNPVAGTTASPIPVYRPQAGQKYYFSGLTVEVAYTQEQVQFSECSMDMNCTSTWYLATTDNGYTFLEAGDTETVNMDHMIELYPNYHGYGADLVNAFHHGLNMDMDRDVLNKLFNVSNGVSTTQYLLYGQSNFNMIFGWSLSAAEWQKKARENNFYLTGKYDTSDTAAGLHFALNSDKLSKSIGYFCYAKDGNVLFKFADDKINTEKF